MARSTYTSTHAVTLVVYGECLCDAMLQELRFADYQAGRNKGGSGSLGLGMGGAKIGGGLFSQSQQSTSTAGTSLFSQNKQLGGKILYCIDFAFILHS